MNQDYIKLVENVLFESSLDNGDKEILLVHQKYYVNRNEIESILDSMYSKYGGVDINYIYFDFPFYIGDQRKFGGVYNKILQLLFYNKSNLDKIMKSIYNLLNNNDISFYIQHVDSIGDSIMFLFFKDVFIHTFDVRSIEEIIDNHGNLVTAHFVGKIIFMLQLMFNWVLFLYISFGRDNFLKIFKN